MSEPKIPFCTDQYDPNNKSKVWARAFGCLVWTAYNYNRLEISGLENIPDKGQGALICPNHPSLLDPAYVMIPIYKERNRWMRWLGWKGIDGKKGFTKWVIDQSEALIPVDESQGVAKDPEEAKRVIGVLGQHLEAGQLIGIFPEGKQHNYRDAHLPYPFRTGAIRIAAANQVPIIPTALYGTHKVWMSFGELKVSRFHMWLTFPAWLPAKVKVRFGEPFYVDERLHDEPDNRDLVKQETERLKAVTYELLQGIS